MSGAFNEYRRGRFGRLRHGRDAARQASTMRWAARPVISRWRRAFSHRSVSSRAVGTDFAPRIMRLFDGTRRSICAACVSATVHLSLAWPLSRGHEQARHHQTRAQRLRRLQPRSAARPVPRRLRLPGEHLARAARRRVLSQVQSPKVVAADTMNHWIENDRPALMRIACARRHPDRQRRRGADAERRA